ncbi:hypothetical protein [Shewanella gaetbuli]|uniref:Uncharacterized protein n=1 Tax=Shewanella gaetbuli TaxID=220752 RepID=A0A9X1ZLE9_9GAMM|nr:hypothetical protein [Shewanella gaetbuli]MCL1143696.1 hypothetical protein [Shewanella gaetbuli]
MSAVKVSMLAVGNVDQFEVTLESIGSLRSFDKRLSAPCVVSTLPSSILSSLKIICDGKLMYGHIAYDSEHGELITSPIRMSSLLKELGYQVFLSPEFEAAKLADDLPLTAEQEREKATYEKETEGVIY